jgi:hypothetical protein
MFLNDSKAQMGFLFLRITLPLLCSLQMLSFYADYSLFFSTDSYILPELMDASLQKGGLSMIDIYKYLIYCNNSCLKATKRYNFVPFCIP